MSGGQIPWMHDVLVYYFVMHARSGEYLTESFLMRSHMRLLLRTTLPGIIFMIAPANVLSQEFKMLNPIGNMEIRDCWGRSDVYARLNMYAVSNYGTDLG